MRVIARTSAFAFKNQNEDIRSIAQKLGVATVIEGSVRQYAGNVRISAQLIRAEDGFNLWSHKFDRKIEDIFKLQDEISVLIAEQIRENFGHLEIKEKLVFEPTNNIDAYKLFLKGRYQQLKWNPKSFLEAIENYNAAILEDPRYARAYYGNVQCYGLLAIWGYMPEEEAMAKAIQNFMVAQELNTNLPEFTLSFIGQSFWKEWDFPLSYSYLKKALKLFPDHTDSLEAMAELMLCNGYFKQAENFCLKNIEIDPLSPNHHFTIANTYYLQKRYAQALSHLDKALSIQPQFALAKELKIMCLIWLNEKSGIQKLLGGEYANKVQYLLYKVINEELNSFDAEDVATWVKVHEDRGQLMPYHLYILANSNHKKEALELLKQYVSKKRGQLLYYRYEPFLEPLHKEKTFKDIPFNTFTPDEEKNENGEAKKSDGVIPEGVEQKINNYIETEKPYLNPQLSLSGLAANLNLHPNKLSYYINALTGKNFNEFINGYRLKEFQAKACDAAWQHLSLLGLAYESGFNSKTVFNAFFKKTVGQTPKEWVKSQS